MRTSYDTSLMIGVLVGLCRSSPACAAEMGSTKPWSMHHVDNVLWNRNSLSPGDVDQDGFDDYAVIHGGPDVYSIVFHPGRNGDLRQPWRKVIIAEGGNAEYAWLGDFDGDGNFDLVCVSREAKPPGARIIWGPEKSKVYEKTAWTDGGQIPETRDRSHFLYVVIHDLDKNGSLDVVVGGRVLGAHSSYLQPRGNLEGKKTTGVIWIECPAERGIRRDLSKWKVHAIDPATVGDHGFVFVDVNQDGEIDIADFNADWNTPDDQEKVLWYENPGHGTQALKQPWKQHLIHQGPEYYSKSQVAVGDIDKDSLTDLVVQTENDVYLFRKTGLKPVAWEHISIPKSEATRWLPRPAGLADLNGDGRLDIVGMLIHDDKALVLRERVINRQRKS